MVSFSMLHIFQCDVCMHVVMFNYRAAGNETLLHLWTCRPHPLRFHSCELHVAFAKQEVRQEIVVCGERELGHAYM